jgi:tetratricopeptide (TPR) repeat protein
MLLRVVMAIAALAFGAWLVTTVARSLRVEIVRRHLPETPSFEGKNAATRALFADARSRIDDKSIDRDDLSNLADLYLAHQYYAEAAKVYRLLAEREPEEFRWPYLEGVATDAIQAWEAAERAFTRATSLDPSNADASSRLSSLQLALGKVESAKLSAARAVATDASYPPAALASARLAAIAHDWPRVIELMTPIARRHPRYSEGHKQLAKAYEMLGEADSAASHRELGTFGEAVEPPILRAIYERSIPAVLRGDPTRAPSLIKERCVKCHTLERTFFRPGASVEWWGWTVRRMQRLGGRGLLSDDEAADIVAYLAGERGDSLSMP